MHSALVHDRWLIDCGGGMNKCTGSRPYSTTQSNIRQHQEYVRRRGLLRTPPIQKKKQPVTNLDNSYPDSLY